jgi:hypothetical protein
MHFAGLFPGNDNKLAIHQLVGSAQWLDDNGHGRLLKQGIAIYDSLDSEQPTLLIPWRDVLDVIRRGCTDGRRERYEAAHDAYCENAGRPLPDPWVPAYRISERGLSADWFYESPANQAHWDEVLRVHRELHEARDAIVKGGCEREPIQAELF